MINVLIIDDSETFRRILARELGKAADIRVAGEAGDPYEARDKIVALRPDVVTLDLEMPRMDGLTFLARLMRYHPMPVVVVSSQTSEGSALALQALELGAIDVLGKPRQAQGVAGLGESLVRTIHTAAAARARPRTEDVRPLPTPWTGVFDAGFELLAVGASTGGPEALRVLIQGLPSNAPPLVIVQHMPPTFTPQFAARLNQLGTLSVSEAAEGDVLRPGRALVAPGDRHMTIRRASGKLRVALRGGPAVRHHRPSIDVLFHSVAAAAGAGAVGALLTGMGVDGAQGLLAMRRAGARTVAQDEASSAVYGMPREALRLGAAEEAVPLEAMAGRIVEVMSRPPQAAAAERGLAHAH